MKKFLLLPLLLFACKDKDPEPARLLSLEFYAIPAVIQQQKVSITLQEDQMWNSVPLTYQSSGQGTFRIKDQLLRSGDLVDLRTVDALDFYDGDRLLSTYTLEKTSVYESYGMGKFLQSQKSLNRSYSYYFDQYNTGIHQYINCGPTVTAMAMHWGDSTYRELPEYVRGQIRPEGGWWYTSDIYAFLRQQGLTPNYVPLPKTYTEKMYTQRLMEVLDAGYLAVLCLDMHYIRKNATLEQKTNRFYDAAAPGWGHFLLVKGYRELDNAVWFEIHDPYSIGMHYADGKLKGENRFYSPAELKKATDIWWEYLITVPQKGRGLRQKSSVHPPPQKGRGFFK
jgi:hypothetical protein